MAQALIGLGSNQGDRHALLDAALERLRGARRLVLEATSRRFATRPAGGPADQGEFLNAAAVLETTRAPLELLDVLLEIEQQLGRRRELRWGPRAIDLDLLLYGEQVMRSERLRLPHPRMSFRRFVLQPAVDVAGDWRHPEIGWSVRRLLHHLDEPPRHVAVTSADAALAQRVASAAAQRTGSVLVPRGSAEQLSAEDPGGRSLEAAIEFLRRRDQPADEHLARDEHRSTQEPFTIWDFWLGEFTSAADTEKLPCPTLLVLLEAVGASERIGASSVADSERPVSELGQFEPAALRQRINDSHKGPRLILNGREEDLAVDEVSAAVEAIVSECIVVG